MVFFNILRDLLYLLYSLCISVELYVILTDGNMFKLYNSGMHSCYLLLLKYESRTYFTKIIYVGIKVLTNDYIAQIISTLQWELQYMAYQPQSYDVYE